jgi:hypothetical protein
MSRAYRIRVRESLTRVVRAHDQVSTQLELLEVLPREEMAEMLARELEARGFRREGRWVVRDGRGVRVEVDLETGMVHVRAESEREVTIEGEREGRAFDETGPTAAKVEKDLRADLRQDLERRAGEQSGQLQAEITDRLEGELADLRKELNQAVNRVTAEALKRKAAQIGQIKEISEDQAAGSLTIVIEV